jgi:DNA anti-recombination protein RmuC
LLKTGRKLIASRYTGSMAQIQLTDLKQLLDALENRINARFESVDRRFDTLQHTMDEGFAAVGEAIERIHVINDQHAARLHQHHQTIGTLQSAIGQKGS